MKIKIITAAAVMAFIISAVPSLAQKIQQPPQGNEKNDEMREKVKRRLETLMLMRIAEDMNLPADKEEKLLLMVKKTLSEREEKARELQQAMKELEAAYDDAKSDAELEKAVSKLEKIQKERNSLESNFIDKLKKTLNTRETARFILLWPQVEEEMRRAIMEMKGRRGQGKMHGEEPGGRPPDF